MISILTKASFILFFLFFCISASFAQISKGTFRLGPEFAFNKSDQEITGSKLSTTVSTLQLTGGYYLIDNLELGLTVQLSSTSTEIGPNEQTSTGTFIGPNLTYMVPLSEELYLPIYGGVGLNSLTIGDGSDDTSLSGIGYGFGAGLEYLVSNKIGARFSLFYNAGTIEESDSGLELDITSTQAGIGINFYFTRSDDK